MSKKIDVNELDFEINNLDINIEDEDNISNEEIEEKFAQYIASETPDLWNIIENKISNQVLESGEQEKKSKKNQIKGRNEIVKKATRLAFILTSVAAAMLLIVIIGPLVKDISINYKTQNDETMEMEDAAVSAEDKIASNGEYSSEEKADLSIAPAGLDNEETESVVGPDYIGTMIVTIEANQLTIEGTTAVVKEKLEDYIGIISVEKEDSIQIRATINDFTEKIDSQKEYKIYIDDIITDEDNNKIYLVKKIEEIN